MNALLAGILPFWAGLTCGFVLGTIWTGMMRGDPDEFHRREQEPGE